MKKQYNISDQDIYNMDEKGFMQGVVGKLKVMISKYKRKAYMTQCGNREWVSLIECVSVGGRVLSPYIIFKAAVHQRAWFNAYPEAHIAISPNGWTDNKIGLLWLQHFAKESAIGQQGQYRMLILDGHASHLSTAAIEFSLASNIILLCLPPHTTHILQPLDVGLFAPLASAYKKNIHRITRLGASYVVDKVDFLEQYQKARTSAFTIHNITSAWEKTGLVPYKPHLIIDCFPSLKAPLPEAQNEYYSITIRPSTPSEGTLTYSGPNGSSSRLLTPATTLQVHQMMKKAHEEGDAQEILKKVGKAASLAMAEATIQKYTNADLLDLNRRKERKAQRPKGYYTNARVLNQEILNKRKVTNDKQQASKAWKKEWNFLCKINPDLFDESDTERQAIKDWNAEWKSLGSINLHLFD